MKIYSATETVWDAAIRRINWLYDNFETVAVNFSGGKDSTVCLNLTLMVAEQRGRLPVPVIFVDQEAEWQCVIDYNRHIFSDPRIKPYWIQCPIKLFNATSIEEPWLYCWEEGRKWVRPKEDFSYHENVFGSDRFAGIFDGVAKFVAPKNLVKIAGVRAEESPARLKGLTSYVTFGGETWGRVEDKKVGHYTMYPIYDWSYTDIWKAIHDNHWPYCKIYDEMYRHGVPTAQMRVSNVHHESAVKTLFYLQEIEGDTWNRIVERISGINTAGQMKEDMMAPKTLPPMFATWYEYRDHLIDTLIRDPEHQEYFYKTFAAWDERYEVEVHPTLVRTQIQAVLNNDYHGTKLSIFAASNGMFSKGRGSRGGDASERRDT